MEKKCFSIPPRGVNVDWNEWLRAFQLGMYQLGYGKYSCNSQGENFSYSKTFSDNGIEKYMVQVLVYDFRKHMKYNIVPNLVLLKFDCVLLRNGRIDMSVSENISISKFEEMAKEFDLLMSESHIVE